jgi:hypothetical protein
VRQKKPKVVPTSIGSGDFLLILLWQKKVRNKFIYEFETPLHISRAPKLLAPPKSRKAGQRRSQRRSEAIRNKIKNDTPVLCTGEPHLTENADFIQYHVDFESPRAHSPMPVSYAS